MFLRPRSPEPHSVATQPSTTDLTNSLASDKAIGYDHGYDAEDFYLGLALDPKYVEGFVEGCLERIGEDAPEEVALFRDLWEDEGQRESVLAILQAECEVLPGRPEYYFPY